MKNVCINCGGELINGVMAGRYGLSFYPDGEIKRLKPKLSKVVCDCCKECGTIQNIRAIELEKIK